MSDPIASAIAETTRLVASMQGQTKNISIAEEAFATIADDLEQNQQQSAADFLPATVDAEQLGLFRRKGSKGLLTIYLDLLQKSLCTKDGELNKLANVGASSAATGVVTLIVSTLALPITAIPLAAPLAAIILTTGIDAFCQWSGPAS